jgi:hypothetical protein
VPISCDCNDPTRVPKRRHRLRRTVADCVWGAVIPITNDGDRQSVPVPVLRRCGIVTHIDVRRPQ